MGPKYAPLNLGSLCTYYIYMYTLSYVPLKVPRISLKGSYTSDFRYKDPHLEFEVVCSTVMSTNLGVMAQTLAMPLKKNKLFVGSMFWVDVLRGFFENWGISSITGPSP